MGAHPPLEDELEELDELDEVDELDELDELDEDVPPCAVQLRIVAPESPPLPCRPKLRDCPGETTAFQATLLAV